MKPARRWTLWLLLLSGSGALILFDHTPASPSQSIAEPVSRSVRDQSSRSALQPASPETTTETMILAIRERGPINEPSDSFAPKDWSPPPPPAPKAVEAPKPVAPPIPYTFLGKKVEDGGWQVFLARNDHLFIVRKGDTLENTYRVQEINPPTLIFLFLPLNEQQAVAIGGAQ